MRKARRIINAGAKFGRLTVIRRSTPNRHRHSMFMCRCVCGTMTIIERGSLLKGLTKSCGCLRRERGRPDNITHGATINYSMTPTYVSWIAMKNRCNNPKASDYKYYGGRGIRVCKRWSSFSEFLGDMGEKPDGLTIERINNERGYSPSNCKWATRLEQSRNTRRNKRVSV